MKAFLQGKWLGHPLHPILVNAPVGLWPAALIFDALSQVGGADGRVMAVISFAAIAVGLAAVLIAVPTGLAEWFEVKSTKPAWKVGLWHLIVNVTATAIWAVNLGLRWYAGWDTAPVGLVPLILSAVGTLLVLIATYLGGRMVYEYGVGVARQSKEYWRQMAAAGGARLPEAKD